MDRDLALTIRESLRTLVERQPNIFGADGHHFRLNKRLSEEQIERFERRHNVRLPPDCRWFLQEIGNGGVGPFYGVFPLGEVDDFQRTAPWQEETDLIGRLDADFPLSEPWNDLATKPPDSLADHDEAIYYAELESFEKKYFFRVNGAIPVCHAGCAVRIWLVVSGKEAGNLWWDDRASDGGFFPASMSGSSRLQFLAWYQRWLNEALSDTAGINYEQQPQDC